MKKGSDNPPYKKPIYDPKFWRERLHKAVGRGVPHTAVYRISTEEMEKINAKHREILAREVGLADWVFDAGCGYGRLIELLPDKWRGTYAGVDLSPDMIGYAKTIWPLPSSSTKYEFLSFNVGKIDEYLTLKFPGDFDVGVCVSIRDMIVHNVGQDEWDRILAAMKRVCQKVLVLEYDPKSEGEVIDGCGI